MLSTDELMALAKQTALIVTEATAPLLARIAELEARPIAKDGVNGRDGIDGAPGKDGLNGADGLNGKDGAPGIDGRDGVTGSVGERGMDGKDGVNGADGLHGKDGAPGIDGADAVLDIEVVEAALDRIVDRNIAKYALDFEIRAGKALQAAVDHVPHPKDGKDGVDGRDGIDGVSMEGMTMEYEPATHEVFLSATIGGKQVGVRFPAGGIRPGGYWREGTKALAGQTWTHDGTMWIALRDTALEPSIQCVDWYIGARKGRDGESAPRKRAAAHSPVVLS